MSKSISTGRVLGASSTAGSATALPAVTGHHTLTIYAVAVAVGCAAIILLSKCIKHVVDRYYARPF